MPLQLGDADSGNRDVVIARPARVRGELGEAWASVTGFIDAGRSGVVDGIVVIGVGVIATISSVALPVANQLWPSSVDLNSVSLVPEGVA
jgi:hypothetical protein